MKRLKKFPKNATAVFVALSMIPLYIPARADSGATVIKLTPSEQSVFNGGEFQGWGTSLCWWANRIGLTFSSSESDEKEAMLASEAAKAFFSEDGLGLDIARYNIGGGDDPAHSHITRSDSAIEGFATGFDDDGNLIYDWTKDARQRNILNLSLEQNPDLIVEGFSNSPPYFMTVSGCSSGSSDASSNNLKDDMYEEFAEYLAAVTDHFKTDWGITFQSLSPMNEPNTSYWGAYSNKQEGCHFDPGTSQSSMIKLTRERLDSYGLDDILVAGTDETSIDTTINSMNSLDSDAKAALGRIDTHTYSGSKRTQLKDTAISMGKNLWMSEVDGTFRAGTSMQTALGFANRVITDMNGMQPSAWILWQAIDRHISGYTVTNEANATMPYENSGYWGLAIANHFTGKIQYTKKYYAYGQFTKYIEPGDTIIASSASTLAAYNKNTGKITIVALNTSSSDLAYKFDLSDFSKTGANVEVIRTSGEFSYDSNGNATDNGESWTKLDNLQVVDKAINATLKANSITTFVVEPIGETVNYMQISGKVNCFSGASQQYSLLTDIENPVVEWSVSDESVATITEDGMLTSVGEGTVTVYATVNGATAEFDVQCLNISEIELTTPMISGSAPWNSYIANNVLKLIDNNTSTYFDGVVEGYVLIDLGARYNLGGIGYAPRAGYEYRMRDGYFEGSVDGETWSTIYTITASPAAGAITDVFSESFSSAFDKNTAIRYVRYSIPDSTHTQTYNSKGTSEAYNCNLSEIKLYGTLFDSELETISRLLAPDREIRTNQYMPESYDGASITWYSSSPALSSDGTVTRGDEDIDVSITALISKDSQQYTATYTSVIKAAPTDKTEDDMEAYLFVHFVGTESTADSEQVYFSVSKDGQTWNTLNSQTPILRSNRGEYGVRDPHIIRSAEGDKFFIVATDLSIFGRRNDSSRWGTCQTSGSQSIIIWESTDLVNWSECRMVQVADENAGCTWAPESIYDDEKGEYMVFWASKVSDDNYSYQRMYRSYTKDFEHFSEPEIYIDNATEADIAAGTAASNIDTSFVKHNGIYYRFTKNESRSSVTMMASDGLNNEFTEIGTYKINGTAGNTITGYEGPTAYKLNGEDKWCLLLDKYSTSEGYKPFITNDITTGIFTSGSDFTFDMKYRHGTVMPITLSEYNSLLKAYSTPEFSGSETVAVSETEKYTVSVFGEEINCEWSVSDTNVATISADGTLTPVAPGNITVTAYSADLDTSYTKEVEILKYPKIQLRSTMASGSSSYNGVNTYLNAIDEDLSTYFDGLNGGYFLLDLFAKYNLQAIAYTPREGYEYRMVGATIEASPDGKLWTAVHTIESEPASQTYIELDLDEAYRYVRYSVPSGNMDSGEAYCCNIAELRLFGEVVGDKNNGLVAHITFDEDGTGDGSFTASVGGTVTETGSVSYTTGKNGNAASITYGTANYLKLPNGILAGADGVTVSMWVKQNAASSACWPFFTTSLTSGTQTYQSEKYLGLLLNAAGTNLTAERYYSSSQARPAQHGVVGTFTDWVYVTVVYDTDYTAIYLNGEEVGGGDSAVDVSSICTDSAQTWIGYANWGSGEGYSGLIDDFKLYSRALSTEEIEELYNSGISIDAVKVEEDSILVSTSVNNLDADAEIFIASYAEDGTLIGVSQNSDTVSNSDGTAKTVKAFAWKEMLPLCKWAEVEIK